MKKGHRRTNSETIGLSRPFSSRIERTLEQQHIMYESKFKPETFNYSNQNIFSIQSLLQKSQSNIAQRVLYIENLEQPKLGENYSNQFAFGKGVNYKLSNFKLNMGEILQVPKSNDSTSLQGQNRGEIMQKEIFFMHETYDNSKPSLLKPTKQMPKTLKFHPKHNKTSSAVEVKKISKVQKIYIPETKYQIKSVQEKSQKDNPLKRPKLQYQIPKKMGNWTKDQGEGINERVKIHKQYLLDRFGINQYKKKKTNFIK